MAPRTPPAPDPTTQAILAHWRDDVPNDRLAHLVRDATRSLTRALQFRLSEHDISFGHWTFLRILWDADGLTQRELSVRAGLQEPTTHSAVLRMEELGFVERRRGTRDKKRIHVHLTAKGRALKKTLVPLAEEVNAVAVEGVAPEDVEAARRVLLAIVASLAEDEAKSLAAGRRITPTRELARKRK